MRHRAPFLVSTILQIPKLKTLVVLIIPGVTFHTIRRGVGNRMNPVKLSRRTVLMAGIAAGSKLLGLSGANAGSAQTTEPSIDRRAVVQRHNPTVQKFDPFSALTVGNGNFAFTADITGLQTFAEECRETFPLCTCAHWAWHTTPVPQGIRPDDFRYKQYDSHGQMVGYATDRTGQPELFDWLRENPHRLHLGRIGLLLQKSNGERATPADLSNASQTLDLWTGMLESRFQFAGTNIRVQTACHPDIDALAIRIESQRPIAVQIAFPYASSNMDMADWNSPDKHRTTFDFKWDHVTMGRTLDADSYFVRGAGPAQFSIVADATT